MLAWADHLGDYGINSVAELIPAKFIVRRALGANDPLVLNADDAGVVAYAAGLDNCLAWFSLDPGNERVRQGLLEGESACFLEEGWLVSARGDERRRLVHVDQVPATRGGSARYNISNALAAVSTALALGVCDDAIREGLSSFRGDEADNPGRGNWFECEISTEEGSGPVKITSVPIDISPAVTSAIALPWKGSGTSATATRSRTAANSTSTSENPIAAPNPYSADSTKLCCSWMLSRATPSTAQLVVIRGR